MNKQEEIREGILIALVTDYYPYKRDNVERITDEILSYLKAKGVAITTYPAKGEDLTGCEIVRIEPLIKEG